MLLGLDLGTTNVKAVVHDPEGRTVAEGSSPVSRCQTADGGVEQDIEEIWSALVSAVGQAGERLAGRGKIRAVGVSSQGGSLQMLDDREKPAGRAISWLDGRGKPYDARLTEELGEEFFTEHLGRSPSALTPGQILRLRQQSPELLAARARIGYVGDVIVGRLCGRRAHDPTSLSIAMLYNPFLDSADAAILQRLQLEEEQLPALLPAVAPAGELRGEAAEALGLTPSIPVSPAIHDQYAAALGAGSVEEGDVCLGTGTAWVLLANTARLVPPVVRGAFACRHLIPGLFGQMLSMNNGGSAIEWATKMLGLGRLTPQQIDEMLQTVPPSCNGLHFWPLLSASARDNPFVEPGGRLSGVTLAHKPEHMLRAVVEGLACELARNLEYLTSAGLPVRRLILCGGAASGCVTPQIIADVTGRPVVCSPQKAASAAGAAVAGRAMLSPHADPAGFARQRARTNLAVQPGKDARTYALLLDRYLQPFSENALKAVST